MIPVENVGELVLDPGDGSREKVIAASSLVRLGSTLCVVADDLARLGVFPDEGRGPGYAISLLPEDDLPSDDKPDLEACVLLPPTNDRPHGSILVLGSGSNENRNAAVAVPLISEDRPGETTLPVDILPLYNKLREDILGLNIEGAAVQGDRLYLLQRGDTPGSKDALISLDLETVQEAIGSEGIIHPRSILEVRFYELGELDGVPLTFSDLSPMGDGRMVFSVSAEKSSGGADGAILGSGLGIFDQDRNIVALEPVDVPTKIEGSTARAMNDGIEVLMVVDDDDPDSATPLLRAVLPSYP